MATFGKSRRFDNNSAQTPAPGAYDPKCLDKAPAAAVLGKRQDKNKENAPPVGHYEVIKAPEAKFPRPTSSASSRSRNQLSVLKKSKRLSRSASSLNDAASSCTGSFLSRDGDIKASSTAVSRTGNEVDLARASPRLEELERDLGVTLQLNDQSEEKIVSLEAENRRLRDEMAGLEATVDFQTEKAEKLSNELAEMRQLKEVGLRVLAEERQSKEVEMRVLEEEREKQAEVDSHKQTLADQSARLAEKDDSIANLNERLAENKLAFKEQQAEKDESIASLNERLAENELAFKGQLVEKDESIASLNEQLAKNELDFKEQLAEKDESIASLNERLAENELAFKGQLVEKDESIASLNEQLKEADGKLSTKDDEYYQLLEQRTATLEALKKEKSMVEEMKSEKEKIEVEHRIATKLAQDRQAELLSELQCLCESQRRLAEDVVGKGEEISKLKEALNLSEEIADDLTGQVAVVEAKCEATKEALLQQMSNEKEIKAAEAEERIALILTEKSDEIEAIQLRVENEKRLAMEVRETLMRQLEETRTASQEKCQWMEEQAEKMAAEAKADAESRERFFEEERSAMKLSFEQESNKMKMDMEEEVQEMKRLSEEKTESQRRLHEEEKSLLVYQQQEVVFRLSSQFDTERTALMQELEQTQLAAAQREANLRRNVEEKESERSELAEKLQRKRNQMEGLLKSQQSLQELMPKVELGEKLLKEKNELEQEMFRRRLEAAQLENTRDAEKREAAENLSVAKEEVSKLQQLMSKLQQQVSMLQQQVSTAEAETKKALDKEDKMRRALAQRKEDEEAMEALRNDACMWESKYQQLTELIGPFKAQLEQYGVERETLMEQKNTTQKELGRLQDDFAKHMGHQNHKQKIHHLVALKEEKFKLMQKNQELQMELAKTQAAHAKCSKRH